MLGQSLIAGILGASSFATNFAPFVELLEPLVSTGAYSVALESVTEGSGDSGAVYVAHKPEVRLTKWNGEVDIGVSYDFAAPIEVDPHTKLARWDSGNEVVEAYPLKARAGMEDGGFEIEIVLDAPPTSNRFEFPIDGYENLSFYYQPPLTEERRMPGVTNCTETECFNERGEVILSRPEDVVGSYAVYHATKRDYVPGEVNYATGKAFQIFRPKAKDAMGHEAWGELSYTKGVLAVTMPEEYLANAVYPVRVDPTFGYTTVGASTIVCDSVVCVSGVVVYESDRLTASSGDTVTKIALYGAADSGTRTMSTALYTYSGGVPVTRTGSAQSVTLGTSIQWYETSTFSQSLSDGVTYAIALGSYPATGSVTLYYDSVDSSSSLGVDSTLPATWSEFSLDVYRLSSYATFTCDPTLSACTDNFYTPGYGSWIAPTNVTSADVACWGGGGGGGDGQTAGGAGGGGGAYAASTVVVTPGTQYTLFIGSGGAAADGASGSAGSPGTDSTFATTTVVADGGSGGAGGTSANTTGGAGGTTANSTGDVENAGGAGGNGTNTGDTSGGGGGAGGPNGAGEAGTAGNGTIGGFGGDGDNLLGGVGGNGGSAGAGERGDAHIDGGGGGGGGDDGSAGGEGAYFGGGGGGGEAAGTGSGGNGGCLVTYQASVPLTLPLPRVNRLFEGFKIRLIEGKMRIMQSM